MLAGPPTEPIDEPVTADDTCIIMYTSGTTGRPKGAMLTHGNLTWNAINVLVDTDLIADERALVSAPLFHTAGLNMLTLPVLLKGGTCVLVEAFDPNGDLRPDRAAPDHLHVRGADDVRAGGPAPALGGRGPVLACGS